MLVRCDGREKRVMWAAAAGVTALAAILAAPAQAGEMGKVLFSPGASGITMVVDVVTGDVSLVGSSGAEMTQYRIISNSGALLNGSGYGGNWISVGSMKNSGVEGSGLDNYVYWMPMFGTAGTTVGDKCCPARDPFSNGRIFFDNLPDHTLDLGLIYDTTSTTMDLQFTYSYGYITDSSVTTASHQVMGGVTYPKPAGLLETLPEGDGVSAFGAVSIVPEPAAIGILGAGGLSLLARRRRRVG